jgi:hypothetical protein
MSRDRVLGDHPTTLLVLVAVSFFLAFTGAAQAITFDAVADFSTSTNGAPAPWSYGFGTTGTNFTPYSAVSNSCYAVFGVSGLSCWHTGNEIIPSVGINTTAGPISGGTIIVPTGVLHVHPGRLETAIDADSIVQFTVPTAYAYRVSGSFSILDTNPTGVVALVSRNGINEFTSLLTGPGASGGTAGQTVSFDLTLALAAGDVVAFGVNTAGPLLYSNDSTGLTATLEPVPEPATLLLLGTTAAGFGLARLRQRRRQKS